MCEPNIWFECGAKRTTHKNILIKYRDKLSVKNIEFIITDMKKVWSQTVLENELNKVCEISGEKETFIENLFKAVKSENSELNFVEPNEPDDASEPNLELIGYFGGLATSFKFQMVEMSDGVYKHITLPLLLLLQHANEEKSFLTNQLKAKDNEILEWRATNASITRGLLKTELFSELETKVSLIVSTDVIQNSAHVLCSIPGYKNICVQMTELNLFDVKIKTTQTETDSVATNDMNTEPGPRSTDESTDVKDEASTSQYEPKPLQSKPKVDLPTKVKTEKRPGILTASTQSQAGKKMKAKKMLI